jgi:hypothetical protein
MLRLFRPNFEQVRSVAAVPQPECLQQCTPYFQTWRISGAYRKNHTVLPVVRSSFIRLSVSDTVLETP